jgi:GDP-L-fucose synthase
LRILITGSTGMVGSNIAALLKQDKDDDLLLPSHEELDLCNANNIKKYLEQKQPEIIIHAAGKVGGIQANINSPLEFFLENLDMGRNLIVLAYELGIKNVLNLGSSCMYPRNHDEALKEDLVLKGELEPTNEGYALAKCAVAKLCEYIDKSNENYNYKTVIPCNLYGPGDKFSPEHSHMVPSIIHKLHSAKVEGQQNVNIWGTGKVRREFMYVEDMARVVGKCIKIFEQLPCYMNVGIGHDYTVDEYYKIVADVIGYSGGFTYDLSKPEGMKRKLVDISIQKSLDLYIETPLRIGIEKTYEFYLKNIADER